MKPTIYRIEFPDGQFYIGATVNFSERRRTHLRHSGKNTAVNPKLQAAFSAYKICGIYEIASGFSREALHTLEAQIIAQESPTLNLNLNPTQIPDKYSGSKKQWGPHKCLRDAAEALGINYNQAKVASRKYSYEQYVQQLSEKNSRVVYGPPDPRSNSSLIFLLGGWHRRADICKVSSDTANDRRRRGWSYEDSFLLPAGQNRPTNCKRVSASSVCARYGVSPNLYYTRRHLGWTVLEAMGVRPRPKPRGPKVKKRLITAGGKTMSLNAWAESLGVTPSVIHARLHSGWSEAEAVGVERRAVEIEREARRAKREARKRTVDVYTHNGFTGTLYEICKQFEYSYPSASNRRYRGLPFDQWFIPLWHYGGEITTANTVPLSLHK